MFKKSLNEINNKLQSLSNQKFWKIGWLWILFTLITIVIYYSFPVGEHWYTYRSAALKLLSFNNPYHIEKFFNPPWALIPVIPFALLPVRIGNAIWSASSLFAFGFVARKLGASWFVTLVFLVLPHTLYNLIQINLDWVVALGFLLPPQIGLFFILIKPQLGAFLALYWLIEAWRTGGIKKVTHEFGPIAIVFLLSFIIFGFYLTKAQFMILYEDKHFWPITVPIGLMLMYISIRDKKPGYSIACAPLLSPYIQLYSWPIAILGLLPDNLWTFTLIVSVWLFKDSGRSWMYEMIKDTLYNVLRLFFQ